MSAKEEDNGKESKEADYDEDKDQLVEEREEKDGVSEGVEATTNKIF